MITGQNFTLEQIADEVLTDYRFRSSNSGKFMGIGLGLTTLDAAFNQDPAFVMGSFSDIFGGWDHATRESMI